VVPVDMLPTNVTLRKTGSIMDSCMEHEGNIRC
jgi:hypothetical protein